MYFHGVNMTAGKTNVLPYLIWLTQIDTQHAANIRSPTTSEAVVTTSLLRGLELRLPAGRAITDYDGNTVKQVSITATPISRPPFPLPNVHVPLYFTIQPGGSYVKVSGNGSAGAPDLSQ